MTVFLLAPAIYVLLGAALWKLGVLSIRTDVEFLAWPFFLGTHASPQPKRPADSTSRVRDWLLASTINTGIDPVVLDAIVERRRAREERLQKAEATLGQSDWSAAEMDSAAESSLLRSHAGLEAATSRRNAALRLRVIRERDAHALCDFDELMAALEAQLVLLEFQSAPDLAPVQSLWCRVTELTSDWAVDSRAVQQVASPVDKNV